MFSHDSAYILAKVPIMTTPMQETDGCTQVGWHTPTESPTKTGGHIVAIPVEHIPDTPVSQKIKTHHTDAHSEPSSSKSRRSRTRSSMERELKALKKASPYGPKRELLVNWTKSGYYRSHGTGSLTICSLCILTICNFSYFPLHQFLIFAYFLH